MFHCTNVNFILAECVINPSTTATVFQTENPEEKHPSSESEITVVF